MFAFIFGSCQSHVAADTVTLGALPGKIQDTFFFVLAEGLERGFQRASAVDVQQVHERQPQQLVCIFKAKQV